MNHDQLLRYSRQILLPDFDIEGQERLLASRVLIIGLGGLGSPVAMYLAAAGVGHLVLVDDDVVDLSNLQRQLAHGTADIGRPKVESAGDTVNGLNPDVTVTPIVGRLTGAALLEQVAAADVVVDACDNFATRFAVNEASVRTGTPLVSGAAIRMEGQVAVFQPRQPDSPCYRCLYKDEGELDQSCSANGVLAPLVGIIGSIQAMETIKVLAGLGEPLWGRLLIFDGRAMEWRTLKLPKDPKCPVCSTARTAGAGA
jgi:molybdopterin/thiamine biosynthesis adenylyltransferase